MYNIYKALLAVHTNQKLYSVEEYRRKTVLFCYN